MTKGTIQHEDVSVVFIYAPKIGPPKYRKQHLMEVKREINRNTVIVGDFNTALASMGRPPRKKKKIN